MQALKWAVWHARHGIFCFVVHIDSSSWLVIYVPCQHAYGTSRGCQMSTEFPFSQFTIMYLHNALFLFLQGIDQDLKCACEALHGIGATLSPIALIHRPPCLCCECERHCSHSDIEAVLSTCPMALTYFWLCSTTFVFLHM